MAMTLFGGFVCLGQYAPYNWGNLDWLKNLSNQEVLSSDGTDLKQLLRVIDAGHHTKHNIDILSHYLSRGSKKLAALKIKDIYELNFIEYWHRSTHFRTVCTLKHQTLIAKPRFRLGTMERKVRLSFRYIPSKVSARTILSRWQDRAKAAACKTTSNIFHFQHRILQSIKKLNES